MRNRSGRATAGDIERRYHRAPVELRTDGDGKPIGFTGHAAVFGKRAWIGPPKWGFWESIRAGAFAKTIREADIRMLFNHDPNYPLARNSVTEGPGALLLSEDEVGLKDEAEFVPTTYARDLALNVDAGVITQQSFSFVPIQEEWSVDDVTGEETRELIEVKVFDVSPVTFPAFTETDASLRSVGFHMLMDALDLDDERRAAMLQAVRSGEVPSSLTPALRAARDALTALVESTGEPESPPLPDAPAASSAPLLALRRRRMAGLSKLMEEINA